jgi:hypothetical protein
MTTETFKLDNQPLNHLINFQKYTLEKNILIQIFCGNDKATMTNILNELSCELPQAKCIATTTDGEINNQNISVEETIISISIFENTTIKSAYSDTDDCFQNGVQLAKNLITKNTKLFILFSDGTTSNGEEFLKGIHHIAPHVIIAGGMAGDNGRFIQTYISEGTKILHRGAVGVSLNSDNLHIKNDFSFNWQTIGLEHTIEKVENNRVYTIDGMSAVDFYAKYLGQDVVDKLPATGIEFPLIVEKNGYQIARAVLSKNEDNSLNFAGNLTCGDKVKLGFGNAELILKESLSALEHIYKYSVESFFIYSCMARRRYMPRFIQMEIKPFAMSAPTTGFFTYGEFFHKDNQNELLNQSLTVVALSEATNFKELTHNIPKLSREHNDYATTIQALTHLINQSTNDYANEAKKVQNLLESQKLFIRHAIHETNTPISVIISNIELFEMNSGKNEYLSNIEAATKSLYNISDDLSYLMKKDQIKAFKQRINLSHFIQSRIDFFNPLALQSHLSFIFKTNNENIMLHINETKLQRIIDNNLTNAIKYTHENEAIMIVLEEYVFKVSSKSTHIQHPEKVFEAYYREADTKLGLGLGLSLVKQICKEEHIKIELNSDKELTSFTYNFNELKI